MFKMFNMFRNFRDELFQPFIVHFKESLRWILRILTAGGFDFSIFWVAFEFRDSARITLLATSQIWKGYKGNLLKIYD